MNCAHCGRDTGGTHAWTEPGFGVKIACSQTCFNEYFNSQKIHCSIKGPLLYVHTSCGLMPLTKDQVAALIPILQHFVEQSHD